MDTLKIHASYGASLMRSGESAIRLSYSFVVCSLATGSDIGGSIRIPAAFCGVVGYKPPYGRVPVMPPFGLDDFCHNGPMGRSVADVALLQDVIAGPHPIDVASVAPTPTLGAPSADVRGWRIGYSVGLGDYVVADDVRRSLLAVVEVFRAAGATVDEIDIDVRRADVRDAASIHFGAIFGSSVGAEIEEHGDVMCEYTKSFAESTTQAAADRGLLAGLEIEDRVWQPIASAVYGYDVVLVPTLATTGIAADQDYYADPIVIDGKPARRSVRRLHDDGVQHRQSLSGAGRARATRA